MTRLLPVKVRIFSLCLIWFLYLVILEKIYLDHNATTPMAPEVLELVTSVLQNKVGNPSSVHSAGRSARILVDEAREQVASFIGAGAQVLGPIQVGRNTKIGSGSVVLQDVPEYSTVIGVPGRVVFSGISSDMEDNDGLESFPDPVARAIECMLERLPQMEKEIRLLKKTLKQNGIDPEQTKPVVPATFKEDQL